MKNDILNIGMISCIVFSAMLEYIGIGDFTRSALMGSTLVYLFWLFLLSGIMVRLIFLYYLRHHKMKRALIAGMFELLVWIFVTGYLFSALYFKTTYDMSIHFKFHYVYELFLFVFAATLLFEKTDVILFAKFFGRRRKLRLKKKKKTASLVSAQPKSCLFGCYHLLR